MRADIAAVYRGAPDLYADGPDGEAARRDAAKKIAALGNAENESFGIELGYAYATSPAICTSRAP